MAKETDFLVIGSGLAGLSFALKVARFGKVCLVTKSNLEETNTTYAQGGIAAVTYKPDTYEKHIEDTLIAGAGLCDESIVRMVVEEAPAQIEQLLNWGANFDRKANGQFHLAKEGGHSEHRILHHKDNTGTEIQRALSKAVKNEPNITILDHCFAVDLITQHHLGKLLKRNHDDIECFGAYILDLKKNKVETLLAKKTMVAAGGIGNIYSTTTNPVIATGDGIAMVYRAKGTVENMEFVQFHPTAFYNPAERPSFLITEAMRGYGAELINHNGDAFMKRYDSRGSLAPRDIVARAIDSEMKISGDDFVYLDCTQKDTETTKNYFPNIYKKLKKSGLDITQERIPVTPAAHYLCGGIKIDRDGKTWIHNLYAAGENASSGMHGANRLASNSLIEAIVFANRAANDAKNSFSQVKPPPNIPDWDETGTTYPEEMVLITQNRKEVQQIMSNYAGIVRSDIRLERALNRLEIIFNETEELYKKSKLSLKLCQLRNMINVGYLVIKFAQERKNSIGLHYTLNYPPE
jgi:L-aspartate oxidase